MRRIEHYRTILHGIPQGFVETDTTGEIVFCNREFGRLFNCVTSNAKGRSLGSILGGLNSASEIVSHITSIIETNPQPSEKIFVFTAHDRPRTAIRLGWNFINDCDGSNQGYVFVFTALDRPISLLDSFHEIEEQHRNLIEHSHDGVIIHQDGTILYANRTAAKISGLDDPSRLTGKSIFDFIHQDLHEILRSRLEDFDYCAQVPAEEQWAIRYNGEIATMEVTSAPVTYMGKPAVQIIIRDRTEWDEVNEKLRHNLEFLRLITENVRDAIWMVDISTFTYTYANGYFEELFGIPVEKIIGSRPGLKLSTESVGEILKVLGEELSSDHERPPGRSRVHLIKDTHYKTGKSIWFEVVATFMRDTQGKPVAIMGIARDITSRKTAEDRLARLNQCFLGFGIDPDENIQTLTETCGELLEGACALYNRASGDHLFTSAAWQEPDGYQALDTASGHICHDVITGRDDGVLIVRDLQNSPYFETDPNVRAYGLQTYIGHQVRCRGRASGSLCVVYQNDFVPDESDIKLLGIIARAIGIEEERKQADAALQESERKYRSISGQIDERC